MKKFSISIMALLGFAVSTAAFSSDMSYLMLGAGQPIGSNDKADWDSGIASIGYSGFTSSISNPTMVDIIAGYQVDENFALEAEYIYSTDETYTAQGGNIASPLNFKDNVNGSIMSAVGILPMSAKLSFLGKLGLSYIHDKGVLSMGNTNISKTGTHTSMTYGAGVQCDFNESFFGRFEVNNLYDDVATANTSSGRSNIWSINLGAHF